MGGLRELFSRGANVLMFARAAPFYARYTLRFHLPAEVLLGCFAGVIRLADLLSRKTLLAPKWMIACQSSAPAVALLLAMVWRDLLDRSDRRRVVLLSGVFGKGVLFLVALITTPGPFLVLILVWSLADSAFLPLRNSIFRANYAREVRGRMFGGVVSLTNLALVAANLLAAHLMDRWDWSYRALFPAAAALGLAGHVVYARVRVRGDTLPPAPADRAPLLPRAAGSLARAFRQTVQILRRDRAYRAYERNFFIYGLGFLMNLPLVVLLVNDRLDLPYEQASLAWLVAPPVVMILLSPLAGRLLDRTSPAGMMAGAGALLALHSALLAVTWSVWTLLASYVVFGAAMTAVNLSWNLGPVQFAPTEREATDYMAVHVTLTGVRGILAPGIAILSEEFLGLSGGFTVAAALYLLSAALMALLSRRQATPA